MSLEHGWAARLSPEQIRSVLDVVRGDGHTIFRAEAFSFLPREVVEAFAEDHHSDTRHAKASIFDERGRIIPSVHGIYGLELVDAIARSLGLPDSEKLGRGFRCREICEALREHIAHAA